MECLHKIFVYSAAYIVQQTPTVVSETRLVLLIVRLILYAMFKVLKYRLNNLD